MQETRALLRDTHGSDNALQVAAVHGVKQSLALNVRRPNERPPRGALRLARCAQRGSAALPRASLRFMGMLAAMTASCGRSRRAVLCCAVLCCAVLCCAVLCCAVLC
jgi:hypothetical protein